MRQQVYQWVQTIRNICQQCWIPFLLGVVGTIAVLSVWQQLLQEEILTRHHTLLPLVILLGGLASVWLLAFTVYWGQRSERHAQRVRTINQQLQDKIIHLLNHLNAGFMVHAPDTHIVQCNTAACDVLGLPMDEIFGKDALDPIWRFTRADGTIMPVEEYPVNRVLSTQMPLENYILGVNRGTQSHVWVLVTAFPEFDDNHQLKQVVVTFVDVSELKRAETGLREMAKVLENAVSGISKLDIQGRYLYVNKAYAGISGYQPEEMVGMSWQETVHPNDLEQLITAYDRMMQDGRVEVEAKGLRKDGSTFYKQLVMIPTYDEQQQIVGHYCFMKDISDRKRIEAERQQAEAALRQSEATKQAIIQAIPDLLIRMRSDGRYVEFISNNRFNLINPEHYRQNTSTFDVLPPDLAQMRMHFTQQALQSGKTQVYEQEILIAGDQHYEEVRIVPVLQDEVLVMVRDITDRKQVEIALRESEERFQAFMNHNPALCWITNSDGRLLYVNPTYSRIIDLPDSYVVGESDCTIHPSEFAQQYLQNIRHVAETQQVVETIEPYRGANGSIGELLVYKFPISSCSEQCLVGGIAIDITERKRIEEALQKSEERLQLALEASEDGLWDWNIETGEVYLSSRYQEMLGYTSGELVMNFDVWEQMIHPEDKPWVLERLKTHLQNGSTSYAFDYRVGCKSDEWIWIADYGKVVARDAQGNPLRMIGTHKDISDRKQAETELKQQKEVLQTIVNHIPVMIALFNSEDQIEFVNPEFERVLGWTLENWQKRDVLLECYPDPTHYRTVIEHIAAANGEWKDFTTLTKTGQSIETSWTNVRLSNGSNLGIGQNISDRKHKEIILRQAMEAAEAANLAKSMFLANMSHELRTPLNVILGFAQVMSHDPSLTPSQKEDLQTIQRSGDHLLSLINDVLDLSKIEAGHCSLEETGFDLISLLHTLRTMMTERAKAKQLQVEFYIAPEVPQFVIADEQKLRQILLNLLSNAIKFTNQGSVMLRVTSWEADHKINPARYPALTSLQNGRYLQDPTHNRLYTLQFEVIDTGAGIATNEQAIIFDAFVQAEAGKKSLSGTGLGLTISRKLLDLMNGEISVYSCPNMGSTFTFTIPVCPTSGVDVQPEHHERMVIGLVPGQSHCRVLVVDDQLENRLLMVRILTQLGVEVREATNGKDAVQIWQDWRPNLTWMDIRMPGVDGYEATRQIRAIEQGQASIIIALTAQASQSDRALALAAGCNDYISKPFREETLFLKLREYLGLEYLYAEPNAPGSNAPVGAQSSLSQEKFLNYLDPILSVLPDLTPLPKSWLVELEEAAVCGNDRAIVELAAQLPPEMSSLAAHLTERANQYQFEQILKLVHGNLPI